MNVTLQSIVRLVQHHWLTLGFILGFLTDAMLLNRIDDTFDNFVLLFYVVLATVSLWFFYIGVAERGPAFLARLFNRYAPLAMQYAFGGLLSGMLIFYGRSGDWLASAPFLLIIIAVIFGNELIGKRSNRLLYHLTFYFIGLFSYVLLVIPVLTGKMGIGIFLLSGVVALGIVTIVVQVLYRIIPHFMALNTRRIIVTIGFVYITFNVLYVTNAIPPIPLSLTELSVVQSVETVSSSVRKSYRVVYEEQSWYQQLPFTRPVLHPTGDSIACFARVYAPTKLETKIYHQWQYKNAAGSWVDHSRIGYQISGSNANGYGGYTRISNFFPGEWRCSVETERGQVLGRAGVMISGKNPQIELITKIE
jgi:hypothetical protein